MRLFPQRFAQVQNSAYVKSIRIGRIENKIVLFDSHGDIVDVSSNISKWKINRIISKLRLILDCTPL